MDELIKEFLIESYENLDRMERDLVVLEKDPSNTETLSSLFRTIHTLKGSSGFLGFAQLEAIAHVGENLLSKMRDHILFINQDIASALLSTVDAVRTMVAEVEANGSPAAHDHHELINLLARLGEPELETAGTRAESSASPQEESNAEEKHPSPHAAEGFTDPRPASMQPVDHPSTHTEQAPEPKMPFTTSQQDEPTSKEPHACHPEDDHRDDPARPSKPSAAADSSIRVDVALLDKLVNLVGELVLARNQVLQFTSQHPDGAFLGTAQRLNLITTELQGSAMKTRMQPIGNIWSKLPRVVRDLAGACGKEVRIEMEGSDTELDKTIIEAIKDPLTHIVRNAVDHGIETIATRIANGKPPQGTLRMRAYHEGGQVNIEITDDGAGISLEKLKAKAVQRGLISSEHAVRIPDHEALHLIFLPGFSTAEKITNISGRGVGMDVVKTNIEKIGGTVDLQSHFGAGTVLRIKIPLTLAIIPALIVTSGMERFAIPQASLLELVRLEGVNACQQIEYIHGAPVYRLRGQLLPLLYLNAELKLDRAGSQSGRNEEINIVVLQTDGQPFGLVLDEINDTQEIVVKPLGKQLKCVSCFAGATIMGDGKVALILDVMGLAQQARIIGETQARASSHENGTDGKSAIDRKQTLLLFSAGLQKRMAIPLSMVARLEEFNRTTIEYSGGTPVVRYRGQILPLIYVSEHLNPKEPDAAYATLESIQVVVYSNLGRSVGLVVGQINDIVSQVIDVERIASGNGILGSVVIQDQVTDLLDVITLIRTADPSFIHEKAPPHCAA
jgi:two-component system chemotaxis sensor kinase CheA